MEPHVPDLAQLVFELDKRTAVFQAQAEKQWEQDSDFRESAHADLKELKALVTGLRIKRAADHAIVSLVVTGAGLLLVELLRKFVA